MSMNKMHRREYFPTSVLNDVRNIRNMTAIGLNFV
jgi:hypothetical protein